MIMNTYIRTEVCLGIAILSSVPPKPITRPANSRRKTDELKVFTKPPISNPGKRLVPSVIQEPACGSKSMDNGSKTRVALFSYNPFVSEGLCSVLGRSPAFEPATWSNNIDEFAACLAGKRPDIALLDLATGLTLIALRDLHRCSRSVQLVLWGDPTIEFGFHAMELGIRGIIPVATPVESLTEALSSIQTGQLWFEKNLMEQLLLTKGIPHNNIYFILGIVYH
jgi:hypothetical protein